MVGELLIAPSELSVLNLKSRLSVNASYLYDKTVNSNLPENKKSKNLNLVSLILDASKMIDELVKADSKRRTNNYILISKVQKLEKRIKELEHEIENLKENI